MDDSNNPVSSSTRRGFLTSTSALATTFLSTKQSVAKVSETKSNYRIGLPLSKRWTNGFADSEGIGSPKVRPGTIADDVMYLKLGPTNVDPAKIVAYDIQSGSVIWETTAAEYVSPPAVIDDTLLVSVVSHLKAYSASEESTSTLWEYESDNDIVSWPYRLQDKFIVTEYNAKPREGGDSDYDYSDGRLSLYSRDGTRQWTVNGNHIENPILYDDSVIHYEGRQYRANGDYHVTSGRVVSRNFETGKKRWETADFDIWTIRPTPTDTVLAYSRNDTVRGIKTETGSVDWTVETGPGLEDYAAGPDQVYIGVGSNLQAINYSTGEKAWSRAELNPYDVEYEGGLVFVGAYGGKFYALDALTGETVWKASHPKGDGFVRRHNGELYTFSKNWVSSYIGKRGEALSALQNARSTGGLGTISTEVADLLGRDKELSRAETAIENRQYDEALSAIDSANQRKVGVEAVATVITGGSIYGGARISGKGVQQKRLKSTLEETKNLYPIQSGAFTGLSPRNLIQQGGAAQDELSHSRWGPRLYDLLRRADDYGELIDALNRINRHHDDLIKLSQRLQKYRDEIKVQPWKKLFEKHLNGELDGIDELITRCSQAINLTAEYLSIQKSISTKKFDLNSLISTIDTAQSPSANNQPPVEYIEAALEALDTYTTVQNDLEHYNLTRVRNQIQNGIDADSSRYSSEVEGFENLTKLLTLGKKSENDRATIDFSYSELTANEVQKWIHKALASLSLKEMKQIRSTVRNLKRGIWKSGHLNSYSPYEFEQLIADLYTDLGYRTQVTKKGSDSGVDVIADGPGEKLIIQVKKYSPGNKIGRPTVQQTAGVREQFGADTAVIVTSSSFTDTAKTASRDFGSRMELINRESLRKMLSGSSLIPPARNPR